MSAQRTVAMDFHGVLARFDHGWRGYDHAELPVPGALAFVQRLLAAGYRVVVVSAGADCAAGRRGIERWLERNGFPALEVTNEKVPAIAYVDDRAVPFRGAFDPSMLDEIDRIAGCLTHGNEGAPLTL